MAEYTPEMLAMLERQRAYFSSDELIKERAAVWRDATPQECLAALAESCAEAAYFLSQYGPDMLEKALEPDPIPDDTVELHRRQATRPVTRGSAGERTVRFADTRS